MASTRSYTLPFLLVFGMFYFNALATSNCPTGFGYNVDGVPKCYSVVTDKLTWDAAQENCRQLHPRAHLVVINSALENQVVQEMLNDKEHDCAVTIRTPDQLWHTSNYFTSGRRTTDDCKSSFVWKASVNQAESLSYTDWLDGEPNCAFEEEHCITIQEGETFAQMQWNDGSCYWELCSVCEVMMFPEEGEVQFPGRGD